MKTFSLRFRLAFTLILLTVITWAVASSFAWFKTYKTINELFDTQQMVFAKRLSVLPIDLQLIHPPLERTKDLLKKKNRGHQDDDALAFAIFTLNGEMVLNDGDNGHKIPFNFHREGFSDEPVKGSDDLWRLMWLKSLDGHYVIAVGQELEYRQEMAVDIIVAQLLPWQIALPIMLILFLWLLTRSLKPLKDIASQLIHRKPNELNAIHVATIPREAEPIVDSLNVLFKRINQMFSRERQFTSDAAHELRSPLTALKVQSEVILLAGNNAAIREQAIINLTKSIDRASRLVDQLLMLSRLESFSQLEDITDLSWTDLIKQAVNDIAPEAALNNVTLHTHFVESPPRFKGQQLLLSILLRNLLHNAIHYGKQPGCVEVVLFNQHLDINDNGSGVSSEELERLGERFYRSPGQEKTGSGLGLSIVKHIAKLHQMNVLFKNRDQGGFSVTVSW